MLLGPYYIRGCLAGAVAQELDPCGLLERARIDPAVYAEPTASVDGIQFQRLVLTVCDALNDEYMGFLRVPGKRQMARLAALAALRGGTLREALKNLCVFVNAVRNDIRVEYLTQPDTHQTVVRTGVSGFRASVDPHLLYWVKMHWLYKFHCWLIGQQIKLASVRFSGQRPVGGVDDNELYGCPVEFGSEWDGFVFDAGYLDHPVVRTAMDPVETLFDADPDWFSIPEVDRSVSRRVEDLLIRLYGDAKATTLDKVAAELCLSARTVTRKLNRENASFQDIKDRVRLRLANALLESTDLPVASIAAKVGFWVPSDFTRAYAGWTGQTPSSFRAGARARRPAGERLRLPPHEARRARAQ